MGKTVEITEKLFAHINNDPFLKGSYELEGSHFINTIGYLNDYISSLKATSQPLPQDVLDLLQHCTAMIDMENSLTQISLSTADSQRSQITALAERWYESIQTELNTPKDYQLFPGGWQAKDDAHAIIYQFQKDENGDLIFTINNSGSGLRYHPKRSIADKELSSPILQYRIPKQNLTDKKNFVPFLQALIEARCSSPHEEYDAKDLYEHTFAKLSFLSATMEPPPAQDKDYIYTGGQLSGTCAQRSIHQMLKSKFTNLDSYRQFIFGFKAFALKEYMFRLKNTGEINNPQKHSQVKNAIRHQLRLLNVDKENQPGQALFTGKLRDEREQELREYLAILSGVSKVAQDSAPAPAPEAQQQFQLLFACQSETKPFNTEQIQRPLLAPRKTQAPSDNNLLEQMKILLQAVQRTQPAASFEMLQQFFLTLPLPTQRFQPLLGRYISLEDIGDKNQFYSYMLHLQRVYFNCAEALFGNNKLPPSVMAIKASNFAVCGHIADSLPPTDLTRQFHSIIQELPSGLSVNNNLVPHLANHHPELDRRLQQVKALYPSGHMFPSYHEALIKHYNEIIHQYPAIETSLKEGYEARFGKETGATFRKIRALGCEALYYYTKTMDTTAYAELSTLFAFQNKLESAFLYGLKQIGGFKVPPVLEFSLHYNPKLDKMEIKTEATDGTNLFIVFPTLTDTLYQLPDGPVKRCLSWYLNQGTSVNKSQILGSPTSAQIQLKQWIKSDTNQPQTLGAEDIEERELFHLKHQPNIQIILTLEYFLQHPEKLHKYEMQVYFEANLFQPGLLLNILESAKQENFWKLLERFLDQGIEASEIKGELSQDSLFYIRMYQSIVQYAYELKPMRFQPQMEGFKQRLDLWMKEPQKPELLAQLHHYRFLTLNAQYSKSKSIPPSVLNELMLSYFLMNMHPLPPQSSDLDAYYRLELSKRAFMACLRDQNPPPDWEFISSELEALGLIPDATQRLTPLDIDFPYISFGDKSLRYYQIDIQQGLIFRDNMAFVHTPNILLTHPVILELGLQDLKQCWQTANKRQYLLEKPPVTLRFTLQDDYSFLVEQRFEIPKEGKSWYQLIASDTQQRSALNSHSSNLFQSPLPPILGERLHFIWSNAKRNKLIITNQQNVNLYTATQHPKTNWTISDSSGRSLYQTHPEIEAKLSGFESQKFVMVWEDEHKNRSIQLPRYGLQLHQPHDQKNLFLEWNDTGYILDKEQSLNAQGIAGLQLAGGSLCVLPVLQYLITAERDPNSEYHLYKADLHHTIAKDIINKKPEDKETGFGKPQVWQYSDSRQAMILKMKQGEPYPETAAQALYLCYLYLASHQETKALAILEACDKRLGGLTGSAEEIQYLNWICNSLPYLTEEEKNRKTDAISTPPVVACQLKALSLLTKFSKSNQRIVFPEVEAEPQTADAFVFKQRVTADKKFYDEGLNTKIYTLYQRYQLMRRDMPSPFLLSEAESRSVLNYYHDKLPASPDDKAPKAIGALGYEWVRLNLINLKKELHHIQQKEKAKLALSDFEKQRKSMILETLEKHAGVYKKQSLLTRVPINLKLDKRNTFNECYQAREAFIQTFSPDEGQATRSYDQQQIAAALEALVPEMDDDAFQSRFGIYLSLALSEDKKARDVLAQYCSAVLLAHRHVPQDQKPSDMHYLCNLLYRVLCEKDKHPQRTTHKEFTKVADLEVFVDWYDPDPLYVFQLQDDTSELLANMDAVYQSIPEPAPSVPPQVSPEQFKLLQSITLFDKNDGVALLSHSEQWQRWEKQFYTGEQPGSEKPDLTEEESGNNKLAALLQLQALAQDLFKQPQTLVALNNITQLRIKALEKDQTKTEQQLLTLANQGPGDKESKQRWDIDLAAEKRKPLDINQLLSLYFKANMEDYRQASGLSDKNVNILHGQIAEFLQRGLILQQLSRIENQLKQPDTNLFKLSQQLLAQNLMPILDNPAVNVYQYHENILLKPHQKTGIQKFLEQTPTGSYQEVVAKIVMGGGKSKVLLPNIAFHKARGDNLVILEVPKALLRTNYVDLQAMSSKLYGQSAVLFEFQRDSDCSPKALEALYKQFNDVIVNKNYLVTTGESMQSLELKYLELLFSMPDPSRQEEFKYSQEQVFWIEHLVLLVKNRGDCLIDEVHQGLLLKNRLNFTLGESQAVPKAIINPILELYQFFTEVTLDTVEGIPQKGLKMTELLKAYRPIQSETQYKQACRALSHALLHNPQSPLLRGLQQEGIELKTSDIPQFMDYLLDDCYTIPDFILAYPQEVRDLIALYKEEVNHLLPFTLKRNANVNYGPSLNPHKTMDQRAVAIPYRANNRPNERSQFGNELECINYTIQSMLINGVSQGLLRQYLELLLKLSKSEVKENHLTSIDQTTQGSLFTLLSQGQLLSQLDLDNPKYMQQLHQTMARNEQLIFEVLKNNVLNNIKFNPKVLSSNALNHVDMMHSVQAFSGTPWNASTYHQRLRYERELAFGTDEYIIQRLQNKQTPIRGADFSQPQQLVNGLLSQYAAKDQIRSIVDISAAFTGISNQQIATDIADYIEKNPQRFNHPKAVKYVLFFDEKDQLSALAVSGSGLSKSIIALGSSNPELIAERLGCTPEEQFIYFDQDHSLGTDLQQGEVVKGIALCNQETGISSFLQGVLRNREVIDGGQSVDIYVPQEIAKGQDIQQLSQGMKEQEKSLLRQDNYLSAHYKMNNLIRQDLLNRVLACNKGFDKKAQLLKTYERHFVEVQQELLFDRFGGIASLQDTKNLLQTHKNMLINSWKQLLKQSDFALDQKQQEQLMLEMNTVIEAALKPEVCNAKQASPGKTEAMEVELFTEVEKREERLAEYLDQTRQAPPYVSWSIQQFLQFKTLKQICQSASPGYVPDFSDNIQASCNFYQVHTNQRNYLGMSMMPVHTLYFQKTKNKLTCTLLTLQEFQEVKRIVDEKSHIRGKDKDSSSWIATSNHSVLAGEMPQNIQNDQQYQQIIEQVRYFSGDLGQLLDRDAPLTWISEDTKQKLQFFKTYLAPGREYQEAHIEQLRAGTMVQNKMLQFIAANPRRDLRHFDWEKAYPTADPSDIKDIQNIALAFYELPLRWWQHDDATQTLGQKYHLSITALGYLSQYESKLPNKKFMTSLKRFIIAFEREENNKASRPFIMKRLMNAVEENSDKSIKQSNKAILIELEDLSVISSRDFYQHGDLDDTYEHVAEEKWKATHFYQECQKNPLYAQNSNLMHQLPRMLAKSQLLKAKHYAVLVELSTQDPELAFSLLQNPHDAYVQEHLPQLIERIKSQPEERIEQELLIIAQLSLEKLSLVLEWIEAYFTPEQQKRFYNYLWQHMVLKSEKINSITVATFVEHCKDRESLVHAIESLPDSTLIPYNVLRTKLAYLQKKDALILERLFGNTRHPNSDPRLFQDLLEHPVKNWRIVEGLFKLCDSKQQMLSVLNFKDSTKIKQEILDAALKKPATDDVEVLWRITQITMEKKEVDLADWIERLLKEKAASINFDYLNKVFSQMPLTTKHAYALDAFLPKLQDIDKESYMTLIRSCSEDNFSLFYKLLPANNWQHFKTLSKVDLKNMLRARKMTPDWFDALIHHPEWDDSVLLSLLSMQELEVKYIDIILSMLADQPTTPASTDTPKGDASSDRETILFFLYQQPLATNAQIERVANLTHTQELSLKCRVKIGQLKPLFEKMDDNQRLKTLETIPLDEKQLSQLLTIPDLSPKVLKAIMNHPSATYEMKLATENLNLKAKNKFFKPIEHSPSKITDEEDESLYQNIKQDIIKKH